MGGPVPARSVHVAVDASRLLSDRRGMGRYVRNVLRTLWHSEPALQTTLYARHARDRHALTAWVRENAPAGAPPVPVALLAELATTAADVVWYPWNFITHAPRETPVVVTIHDIAPMRPLDPRWWKGLSRWRAARAYRATAARADHILTVSRFSGDEIIAELGVAPSRVTVTPLAADDLPIDGADDDALLARLQPLGPFFLSVGGRDARKNLGLLDSALQQLWTQGERVPLVQCGPWRPSARRAAAPWLHELGYVSDAELVTLYRHAVALVFPSRYEGFGLPVVEAMRAGCAVIVADGSSLTEVSGGAAVAVPWDDAAALASAMRQLLHDPRARAARVAAGRERAAELSWQATASVTFAALTRAAR